VTIFILLVLFAGYSLKFSLHISAQIVPSILAFIIMIYLCFERQEKSKNTGFKCPLVPITPLLGIVINGLLLTSIAYDAILRVLGWTIIGFIIYFAYGIRHSKLENDAETEIK